MTDESQAQAGRLMGLPAEEVPGVPGIEKRVVFGPGKHWEDYVMRCFTLPSGGAVPMHSHDWPHYALILQGHGSLEENGRRTELTPMSWAYVPPRTEHSFQAGADEPMVFICIVPKEGDQPPQAR